MEVFLGILLFLELLIAFWAACSSSILIRVRRKELSREAAAEAFAEALVEIQSDDKLNYYVAVAIGWRLDQPKPVDTEMEWIGSYDSAMRIRDRLRAAIKNIYVAQAR